MFQVSLPSASVFGCLLSQYLLLMVISSFWRLLGGNTLSTGFHEGGMNEADKDGSNGQGASYDDVLTPTERRFLLQTEKLEIRRLAKMASKSHRDRVQEFNQ